MKSTNINPVKTLTNTTKRYNFVIFFVILAIGLMMAVIMLTNIFIQPNDTNLNDSALTQSFDQITIDKLNRLYDSTTNVNYKTLSSGRTNIFSE